MTLPDPSVPFDTGATMRAARILIDRAPGPATRLDVFLLLAGQEPLWRRDGPGADFAEAVRRYEAAAGTTLARHLPPPSFGVVKWRGAERRHEVAVWLAGRFLGWLSSPTPRCCRSACDWRADTRLLVSLGLSHAAARDEPPRDRNRTRRRRRAALGGRLREGRAAFTRDELTSKTSPIDHVERMSSPSWHPSDDAGKYANRAKAADAKSSCVRGKVVPGHVRSVAGHADR